LSGTITSILQGVTFPILTSLQGERDRLLTVYVRLMRMIVFFVIPSMTLMILLSEPFVRLLLTEKWLPIVPLMQWMCLARIFTPIAGLNLNVINAVGRSDLFLLLDAIKFPILLASAVIALPFGLTALVIGIFLCNMIGFFINAYYPGKLFGFGAFRQIKEMWRVICATLIMTAVVYVSIIFLPSDLLKLLVGVPLGGGSYLLAAYLLKIEEISEVKSITKSIIMRLSGAS